jgi:hypothetical protein
MALPRRKRPDQAGPPANVPEPSVEGVRLFIVDTGADLQPAEKDLHCMFSEGYQPAFPPVTLADGRVLFVLTLVEWG